jgi:hypothetical protein
MGDAKIFNSQYGALSLANTVCLVIIFFMLDAYIIFTFFARVVVCTWIARAQPGWPPRVRALDESL